MLENKKRQTWPKLTYQNLDNYVLFNLYFGIDVALIEKTWAESQHVRLAKKKKNASAIRGGNGCYWA